MPVKYIIWGPNVEVRSQSRKKEINKSIPVIVNSTKSSLHENCEPKENEWGVYTTIEAQLTVGLGLYTHQKAWNKKFVETLNHLDFSVTYDR